MITKPVVKTVLEARYARAFFSAFLVALLITWGPINALAYVMPLICLAWFIVRANSGKTFLALALFLILFCGLIVFYEVLHYSTKDINFQAGGALLTLITYSSFVFLLITPHRIYHNEYSYLRYARILKYLIVIQATLGVTQVFLAMATKGVSFDGSIGDQVQGTMNPISFLAHQSDFRNISFAANMGLLLAFYAPYVFAYGKGKLVLAWGAFALLCASVLHIMLAFVGAIMIVGFLYRNFSKVSYKIIYVLVFIGIGIGLLARLQPGNFTLIKNYAIIYAKAKSPKVTSTIDVVTDVPQEYPTMLLIGFGPGQYSSRASLIATGKYLGGLSSSRSYFFLPNEMTEPFERFLWDDWQESDIEEIYGGSAMSKPFYSIMSIYTEFGLVVLLAILLYIASQLLKLRKIYLRPALSEDEKVDKFLAFSLALSFLFLFFVCFIENYLEISQAIFPGLLMIKYFSSRVYSTAR